MRECFKGRAMEQVNEDGLCCVIIVTRKNECDQGCVVSPRYESQRRRAVRDEGRNGGFGIGDVLINEGSGVCC